MVLTHQQLIADLRRILSERDLLSFVDSNSTHQDTDTRLAQLVTSGVLTSFQADQIKAGRTKSLIVEDYLLCDRLGKGGMGEVYRAVHRFLDREVALKIIRRDAAHEPEMIARFRRETKLLAQLNHRNVVTAFDGGESEGMLYLVTELLPSETLHDHVKTHGPLPLEVALNYTLQAARGLECAHQQGVIHRDFKPSNLLITEESVVKILDLGLAKINTEHETDSLHTQQGAILGTIDYMSPEQCTGGEATELSDIYSLGCCLYFFLTGGSPFGHLPVRQRMAAHVSAPRPNLHALAGVNLQVEELFQKMIAQDPGDRLQSAQRVCKSLETVVSSMKRGERDSVSITDSGVDTLPPFVHPARIDQQKSARPKSDKKMSLMAVAIALCALALLAGVGAFALVWFIGNPTSTANEEKQPPLDGKFIAWPDLNNMVAKFDHQESVEFAVFSPDSKLIASGGWDGDLRLWDLHEKKLKSRIPTSESGLISGLFYQQGQKIIVGSADGHVLIIDRTTESVILTLDAHESEEVYTIVALTNGEFVSGGDDGRFCIWDGKSKTPRFRSRKHKWGIGGVGYDQKSNTVISIEGDGSILLWDAAVGEEKKFLETDQIGPLVFEPMNRVVFAGYPSGVKGWKLDSQMKTFTQLKTDKNAILSLAVSTDGGVVAAGGEDGRTIFWSTSNGKLLSTIPAAFKNNRDGKRKDPFDINTVAFSIDDTYFATGCDDDFIRVWKLK